MISLVLLFSELRLPASCMSQVRVNREYCKGREYHADEVPPDRGPDGFEIDRLHQTGKFEIFVNTKRTGNEIDNILLPRNST